MIISSCGGYAKKNATVPHVERDKICKHPNISSVPINLSLGEVCLSEEEAVCLPPCLHNRLAECKGLSV